jgi:DNA-directed RNA polymerase specialized sigma24 family protein
MTENHIVRQLQGIAEKLTADPDLQKDLMQEMFVHLVRIQTAEAGQTLSWYLKSCEFHARNYLKPGRRIDSLKRSGNGVPDEEAPAVDNGEPRGNGAAYSPAAVAVEIQGERITNDIVNRIVPRLSDMQQQILFLLMKGCGVRETGREVGITHPAVIKHRKKIARVARELLRESAGLGGTVAAHNGANGNGNGEVQSN